MTEETKVEVNDSGQSVVQTEMPFAVVQGEPLSAVPVDLYIPPDALEVILEAFEGPLDLLLYLIKRQNLDILEIPIARITQQYMEYIQMMDELQFELAAEYLVMAAMLAEIKSRMLLPKPNDDFEDEDDPRAELIRRLQEYEQFKQAAEDVDNLPRNARDTFVVDTKAPEYEVEVPEPDVDLKEMLIVFQQLLKRTDMYSHHQVQREALSVRQRMSMILERVNSQDEFIEFTELFDVEEGRLGVVVSFLSILELLKEHLINLAQSNSFAPIYITSAEDAVVSDDSIQNAGNV